MQQPESNIHYHVNLLSISGHFFEVTLHITKPNADGQLLSLPAWIPGSYMIRDFAKNIITIRVIDDTNKPLSFSKLDKQTWRISPHSGPIKVIYQVYAYDLSVRGAYINDEYAFFNGTNMFLAVEGQTEQSCSLSLIKPLAEQQAAWRVATTMPSLSPLSHDFGEYWAKNYDELIDHPVLLGEFDVIPFETSGVKFELILAGGHQADTARIQGDLTKICQHHIDFFADTSPVDHYQFITLLTDNAFGGLEHISSTALMFSRNDLPSVYQKDQNPDGYQTFLSLCSHEFFHTWHVKRIQPDALHNAALNAEKYTEQLWIYEGFTSYYDDLSLLKCGLINQTEYLKILSKSLTRLIRNQGRFKQTVTGSSFDAWTKFYKQDEGAINNIVSYYNKGAILAMCLDLIIRQKSQQQYCLDDVMRILWHDHGKISVPTHNHVIHDITQQQLGLDLTEFLHCALYTVEELPFEKCLSEFGIKLSLNLRESLDETFSANKPELFLYDFGAKMTAKETGVHISQVSESSAAETAGLLVNDHLITIGIWQVSHTNIKRLLNNLSPEQKIELTVLRDKKLKKLMFTAIPAKADSVSLAIIEQNLVDNWLR